MGDPLVIYNRQLANPGFELGTIGVLPTGWSLVGSPTKAEISVLEHYDTGRGLTSRSLLLRAASGDEGVQQTVTWAPQDSGKGRRWLAFLVAYKAAAGGAPADSLEIKHTDVGGSPTTRSALVTPTTSWQLASVVWRHTNGTSTGAKLELLADSAAGVDFYVDHCFLGEAFDLQHAPTNLDAEERQARGLIVGRTGHQAAPLHRPATSVAVAYGPIDDLDVDASNEDLDADDQLHAWRAFCRDGAAFSWWTDRDAGRNQDLAWEDCLLGVDHRLRYDGPGRGVIHSFKFDANREGLE